MNKNVKNVDTITITKDEYFKLKVAQEELSLLEQGGVDNWEGYCDSLNDAYGDIGYTLEEITNNLFLEIYGAETCQGQ